MKTKKLYSAKCFRNCKPNRKKVSNSSGVYKWWCSKKDLLNILKRLNINPKDCVKNIEKIDNATIVCACGNDKKIKGTFYCIYIGESSNLHKRILSNHINGNIDCSTLRKTIASMLIGKVEEAKVDSILDNYFVEWEKASENDCKRKYVQNKYINDFYRPLNNNNICKSNEKYSSKCHYEPTKNSKYKYSSELTRLRNKLKKS